MKRLTMKSLMKAALDRRSVWGGKDAPGPFGGPLPAAFVVGMQFACVVRQLDCGLYVYQAKKPAKRWGGK